MVKRHKLLNGIFAIQTFARGYSNAVGIFMFVWSLAREDSIEYHTPDLKEYRGNFVNKIFHLYLLPPFLMV